MELNEYTGPVDSISQTEMDEIESKALEGLSRSDPNAVKEAVKVMMQMFPEVYGAESEFTIDYVEVAKLMVGLGIAEASRMEIDQFSESKKEAVTKRITKKICNRLVKKEEIRKQRAVEKKKQEAIEAEKRKLTLEAGEQMRSKNICKPLEVLTFLAERFNGNDLMGIAFDGCIENKLKLSLEDPEEIKGIENFIAAIQNCLPSRIIMLSGYVSTLLTRIKKIIEDSD